MNSKEDIVDLLKKKKQIETELAKFKSKEKIISTEEEVIDDMKFKLSDVQKRIEDY